MTPLILTILIPLGLVAYAWIIYPVMVWILGSRRHPERQDPIPDPELPPVTVLVPAHNEETDIGPRIHNLLAQDYPSDRLTVLIGVDGSTDGTASNARTAAGDTNRVQVIEFHNRQGKTATLKALARQATATVLAFTDANTRFEPHTIRRLVEPLADPRVGGVCGRLILHDPAQPTPESSYWEFETLLKRAESRLDSCLGANGAVYALRRDRFWQEIPDTTIVDDFVVGMKVREQGYRLLYREDAVAYEPLPDLRHEWQRRVRIGTGDYQALALCRRCLSPRYGRFAWMFASHKVLRWFTPHLVLAGVVLASADVLAGAWDGLHPTSGLSIIITLGSGLFLMMSAAGRSLAQHGRSRPAILVTAWHFLAMQTALIMGFVRYCRGSLQGAWDRTPRKIVERGK